MPEPIGSVTTAPLDKTWLETRIRSRKNGAVVTFEGIVRDHDHGEDVGSLDYEAHPDAERILIDVCTRIAQTTDCDVVAAHRIGHLEIGDVGVVERRGDGSDVEHRRSERDDSEVGYTHGGGDVCGGLDDQMRHEVSLPPGPGAAPEATLSDAAPTRGSAAADPGGGASAQAAGEGSGEDRAAEGRGAPPLGFHHACNASSRQANSSD